MITIQIIYDYEIIILSKLYHYKLMITIVKKMILIVKKMIILATIVIISYDYNSNHSMITIVQKKARKIGLF